MVLLSLGILAAVGCLVALAHLHGNPPTAKGAGFPDPALATLAEPGVAAVVSFAALVSIAWCVRHLRFEFLSWWPGRIVVHSFVATDGLSAAEVERLTAGFRDRLGMSHLQSPAPVPTASEQGDFLDVLGRSTADAGTVLGSLIGLLRSAIPAHAYEVKGALSTRDGPCPYGVTVHVVRLPGKGGGGHTVWDASWEGAVRQAADHATAAVLPRTRICRSPWAGWRRYYLPPDLLRDYEQAAECEQSRRYDQALALYYRAAAQDPMNHCLRLQIGFLQEKLGLYLDALETYQSILDVAEPKRPKRAWRPRHRDDVRKSHPRPARRDRDRSLLVSRYRRAVLLGGPRLPHQWRKEGEEEHETRRDEERDRLRDRLKLPLARIYARAHASPEVEQVAQPLYRDAGREPPRPADCLDLLVPQEGAVADDRLEQIFLMASLHELADLQRRIPLLQLRRRHPLTRAAAQVSSLVVREQLRLRLGLPDGEPGWYPYIERVNDDLGSIERPSGFDRWQEHYNAACIYALPLLTTDNSQQRADVQELTRRAVERLEWASERADSAFLASRRDWLVAEDPDLRGLRVQPEFKSFEAAYFPSVARTPQRPREVHRWAASRYTLDMLRAAAQRWQTTWEQRALNPVTDTCQLLGWWVDELSARRLVREVALHHRDWRTRLQLLDQMNAWSVEYGFDPVETAFPGFPAPGEPVLGDGDIDRATRKRISDNDARLAEVVKQLANAQEASNGTAHHNGRGPDKSRVARLLEALETRRARVAEPGDAEPRLELAHVAHLCRAHATLWRTLAELLRPSAERDKAARELAHALAQSAGACKGLQQHWTVGSQSQLAANRTGPASGSPAAASG